MEIEVENFAELNQALDASADITMLDNFSRADAKEAVTLVNGRAKIEISGNVAAESISALIEIGRDYVSSAALTGELTGGFVDASTMKSQSQLIKHRPISKKYLRALIRQ